MHNLLPTAGSSYFTPTLESLLFSPHSTSIPATSHYTFLTRLAIMRFTLTLRLLNLQHSRLLCRREPCRDQRPQSGCKRSKAASPLHYQSPHQLQRPHRIRWPALRLGLHAARLVRPPIQTSWRRRVPFGVCTIWRAVEYQCWSGLSVQGEHVSEILHYRDDMDTLGSSWDLSVFD